MDIWQGIRSKRTVRNFTDQPISDEDARHILEAGRLAPSGWNSQPWYFIAVRDRAALQELSTLGRTAGHVAGAAMCVVILSPDRETRFWENMFDIGNAATYMMLAAHERGIASAPANVYEADRARELLEFPEDWKPFIMFSFGYPDPEHQRPGRGKDGRRPFDDVVRWDKF